MYCNFGPSRERSSNTHSPLHDLYTMSDEPLPDDAIFAYRRASGSKSAFTIGDAKRETEISAYVHDTALNWQKLVN